MPKITELEPRYLVLKMADVRKYLTDPQIVTLCEFCGYIDAGKHAVEGKLPQEYICIGKDWPEYEHTKELLLKRLNEEDKKSG